MIQMKRIVFMVAIFGLMVGCTPFWKLTTYKQQYIDTRCNESTKKIFEELLEYFVTHNFSIKTYDPERGYLEVTTLDFYSNEIQNQEQTLNSRNYIRESRESYGNWIIISKNYRLIAVCKEMEPSKNSNSILDRSKLFLSDSTVKNPSFNFYWKTRNEIERLCGSIEFKDRP